MPLKNKIEALKKLEEMGLKPAVIEGPMGVDIQMLDPNGKAFSIPFNIDADSYEDLTVLKPPATVVPKNLRGKGIATEAYKAAEKMTGLKVFPDDLQTKGGFELHTKKGMGKEFGLSDEQVDSILSPEDLQNRNIRKKATLNAIQQAANALERNPDANPVTSAGSAIRKEIASGIKYIPKNNAETIAEKALFNALETTDPSDYLRKNASKYVSRVMGLVPGVGTGVATASALLAGSAQDALANAIPGGVDSAGEDSDNIPGPEMTRHSPFRELAIPSEKEYRAMQEFGTGEKVQNPDIGEARRRMDERMSKIKALIGKKN
jgi:hypothetical protein